MSILSAPRIHDDAPEAADPRCFFQVATGADPAGEVLWESSDSGIREAVAEARRLVAEGPWPQLFVHRHGGPVALAQRTEEGPPLVLELALHPGEVELARAIDVERGVSRLLGRPLSFLVTEGENEIYESNRNSLTLAAVIADEVADHLGGRRGFLADGGTAENFHLGCNERAIWEGATLQAVVRTDPADGLPVVIRLDGPEPVVTCYDEKGRVAGDPSAADRDSSLDESAEYKWHPPKPGRPRPPLGTVRVMAEGHLDRIHEGRGLTAEDVVDYEIRDRTPLPDGPDGAAARREGGYDLTVMDGPRVVAVVRCHGRGSEFYELIRLDVPAE